MRQHINTHTTHITTTQKSTHTYNTNTRRHPSHHMNRHVINSPNAYIIPQQPQIAQNIIKCPHSTQQHQHKHQTCYARINEPTCIMGMQCNSEQHTCKHTTQQTPHTMQTKMVKHTWHIISYNTHTTYIKQCKQTQPHHEQLLNRTTRTPHTLTQHNTQQRNTWRHEPAYQNTQQTQLPIACNHTTTHKPHTSSTQRQTADHNVTHTNNRHHAQTHKKHTKHCIDTHQQTHYTCTPTYSTVHTLKPHPRAI